MLESMPAFKCMLVLALAIACTPMANEEGGDDGSTSSTEGSESGDGDGDGDGEEGVGELCDPAPYQSSDICGDGIVGEEELCDDANDVDDDGCSNACESTRGEHVINFVASATRAIAGVPGPTPEETTIVVGTDPASLVAFDIAGVELWSTPLGGSYFAVQDVQVTDTGEYIVAGVDTSTRGGFDLWLAHLDAQGQVISAPPPDPNRGAPHADTLLRADGSLVVVGFRPTENGFSDHSGVFTYDVALNLMWEAPWWGLALEPVEPAELSDGTIIVVAKQGALFEGGQIGSLGLQLTALDPDGGLLWAKGETCSVDIGAHGEALAALSDDTILVSLSREGGSELLRYNQDQLVSRERWPVHSGSQQIIADDQGGAWLVGDRVGGSFVAYWHPDPARRWIGPTSGPHAVNDAWLEPGRRIWYATSTGEVFAVSI